MTEWKKVEMSEAHEFKEDGDSVEGVLVSIEDKVGENNSMLYELQKEDGEVFAVWGSTVLDRMMRKAEKGKKVKIVFKGKKMGKKGREYKDFEVFIDEKEAPKEEKQEENTD